MATKSDLTLSKLLLKNILNFAEKADKEEILEVLKQNIEDLEKVE